MGIVLMAGCGDGGLDIDGWAQPEAQTEESRPSDPVHAALSVPHAAAGYLEVQGSPILPWCAAVLVAPDVVVTAAQCLQGAPMHELRFGVGSTETLADGRGAIDVVDVLPHPQVDEPRHALVALALAEPVVGVTPASLTSALSAGCGFEAVSYRFHLRGDAGERTRWSGCVDGSVEHARIRADAGVGDCHGDDGAGIFAGPDDDLVGLVVRDTSRGVCTTQLALASVADNIAFFDAALDLSMPPP